MNRRIVQVPYWIISGAFIGVGLIAFDVWFIFVSCLVVGLILSILGLLRWRGSYLWAGVIGLGAAPAFFVAYAIVSSLPFCPPQNGRIELTIPPNVPAGTGVSCGVVPVSYYVLLAICVLVALAGGAWPLLRRMRRRSENVAS